MEHEVLQVEALLSHQPVHLGAQEGRVLVQPPVSLGLQGQAPCTHMGGTGSIQVAGLSD